MSTNKPAPIRPVLKRGQFTEAPDTEVDYEFESPSQFFGHELNLVPAMSSVTAQRSFYTSKFFNQALPIHNGEAPLVQTLKDPKTGETFEEALGPKMGAVVADDDDDGSTIIDVKPDYIKYKNKNGEEKTKDLYNNFNFNRKTFITNLPVVKPGDTIKKGQLLARSNYTNDKGVFNMGLNAKIAIVPYKGWSYEDGVVISEDFAKKLASEHMYSFSQDFQSAADKKQTVTGKDHFASLFPKKFDTEKLKNINDDGVVKVGTIVKQGDPLILATKPRMVSSKDSELGRLSKYLGRTRTDASLKWEHEADGVVTDVVKTKNGWKVNVASIQPARPGDKVSIGRSGSKGTITKIIPQNLVPRTIDGKPVDVLFNPLGIPCYSDDTEILTKEAGWISVKDITKDYTYMTLNPKTLYMEWQKAEETHHYPYQGKMYHLSNQQLDWLVTPNHNHFSIKRGSRFSTKKLDFNNPETATLFDLKKSSEIFGETRQFIKGALWEGNYISEFTIPPGSKSITGICKDSITVTMEDWVQFMAWFVTEGYTSTRVSATKGTTYIVGICQSTEVNPDKYAQIEQLLMHMKLHFCKTKNEFIIMHKGLYELLAPLGKANEKYIPRYILDLSPRYLQICLDTMLLGDGSIYTNEKYGHYSTKSYTTTSKKLIDNVQELCAKLQIPVNIKVEKRSIDSEIRSLCYIASIQKGVPSGWINWSEKQKTRQIEEWVDYNGMVHCVTVPNSIVFVRRNGKAVFSGNSRVNANLIYAMMLGKIAEKTGKTIKVPSFGKSTDKKWYDYVSELMKENGVTDAEPLYDPEKDRILDQPVTVGTDYIIKMHHTAESKYSARGLGSYSSDLQPLKGGTEGSFAKRFSGLESYGLLSAGAYEFIKDAIHLRGQRNDDYWRAVRNGETPSLAKKSPFVWDKYLALMQGAGINTLQKPNGVLQASPFTDKQFEALNPKELENPYIVDLKTMKPVEGGLFDPANALTGRWGKITLNEPYPNPGFEDAIASLLNIRKQDMYKIMTGDEQLGKFGTGTKALQKALASIDMEKMFNEAKEQFKHGPKSSKQKALNKMKYIKGLEKNELTPDALMITRIPVIPAKFRPYSAMGDTFIPGDVNELYKDVYQMRDAQKELQQELGEKEATANSLNMYNSIKALYGFGESMNKKLKQRGVSGFMNKLVGGTSKFSFLNRSVTSTPDDFTGRSVIDVDPDLGMDEVGLPIKMAFTMFAPYIQQRLVQQGMNPAEAIKAVENKTDAAKKALENIVESRYVTISRAPAWHKYNMVGAKVKLHDSNNITVSPLYTKGMSADFDGDFQLGHVYMLIKKS